MKKILVGLSGLVDSAVSAYLLKKQGYDFVAGFMINYLADDGEYCLIKEDIEVSKEVAKYLDIPFYTFDYRETYADKVLGYMYDGYHKGITLNPDIMCNSEVKFKVFLDEALEHGFYGAFPEKGKANKELIDYLSKSLSVKKSKIEIISGITDQNKVVKIDFF